MTTNATPVSEPVTIEPVTIEPDEAPAPRRGPAGMQDMTTGPVTRHLLKTTSFMLVIMLFQTLYFLIDLYWVGRLGTDAVAAVGIAGNLSFIVLGLTQMIGIGTTTVVSHAVGRKDHDQALVLFNQSQVLSMVTGVLFLIVGLAGRTDNLQRRQARESAHVCAVRGTRTGNSATRPRRSVAQTDDDLFRYSRAGDARGFRMVVRTDCC